MQVSWKWDSCTGGFQGLLFLNFSLTPQDTEAEGVACLAL